MTRLIVFSFINLTLAFHSNSSLALEQGDRCYLTETWRGKIAFTIGKSYDNSRVWTKRARVSSVEEAHGLVAFWKGLKKNGLCPQDPNPGTCYLDRGWHYNGISIKDTNSPAEERNLIFSIEEANWTDYRLILDELRDAGVCTLVEY